MERVLSCWEPLLIAQLQKRTGLATDAMIAVVFAGSLAAGAALTPQEDLVDALFGEFQQLSFGAFAGGLLDVSLIIYFVLRFKDQLILSLFSPELASTTGVKLERLNLGFLFIFSLAVLIGLRFMGALLAGALIMLPATIGRRLSNNLQSFLCLSCVSSILAVSFGFALRGHILHTLTLGPATTLAATILFGVSLLYKAA